MIQTEGIVLNEIKFQDTSKILNIFTKDLGKINIMAKGAYSPKSKIIAQTQPFACSEFEIQKGKSWYYIKDASLINSHYNIREEIERISVGFFMLELVNKSVQEESKNENIYLLLNKTLEVLSNLKDGYLKLLLAFEVKYISFLGYRPCLNECLNCGSTSFQEIRFSISNGGVICQDCLGLDYKSIYIGSSDLKKLNELLYSKLDELDSIIIEKDNLIKLHILMEKYILYNIDRVKLDSAEMLHAVIYD